MISLGGLLLGIINIAIVLAILVLVGALVVWIAGIFQWPIPWTVQRLYLLIVLLIGLYMLVALMLGMPSIHLIAR